MMATTEPDISGQEDLMMWLRNGFGLFSLGDYLSYGIHALWLLVPLILGYSVRMVTYCLACLVNVLLYINKKRNIHEDPYGESWGKARKAFANVMTSFANIWYGYEIIGMENLPKGPGLIIYYHGPVAVGYASFICTLYKQTGRLCYSVCDHLLYHLPGNKLFLELGGFADINKAECVELLKKGELLGIPPGGLREVNFSDNNYTLIWGDRTGFAQVALEAKVDHLNSIEAIVKRNQGCNPIHTFLVPIIPLFTQNIREAFWTVGNSRLTRWLYEHFRWIILPTVGGLPVKLRTFIGEPIPYDPNITAQELAEKTKTAIENLRDRYQKRPGNIMRALLERFDKHHKDN